MMCNGPLTSGGRYQPELPVWMFQTIDNVTMINESTGAFPNAAHRPARRWPGAVLQGQYPLVLDALQAAGAAWHTAAPVCARGSALTRVTQRVQTNYQAR
jgi:hypothetical protein